MISLEYKTIAPFMMNLGDDMDACVDPDEDIVEQFSMYLSEMSPETRAYLALIGFRFDQDAQILTLADVSVLECVEGFADYVIECHDDDWADYNGCYIAIVVRTVQKYLESTKK